MGVRGRVSKTTPMTLAFLALVGGSLLFSACGGGGGEDGGTSDGALMDAAPECASDAECDDGVFCNGAETCDAGSCVSGEAPACDDGVSCTVDRCDAVTDACASAAPDVDGDGFGDFDEAPEENGGEWADFEEPDDDKEKS